jgi:hypothetical protein
MLSSRTLVGAACAVSHGVAAAEAENRLMAQESHLLEESRLFVSTVKRDRHPLGDEHRATLDDALKAEMVIGADGAITSDNKTDRNDNVNVRSERSADTSGNGGNNDRPAGITVENFLDQEKNNRLLRPHQAQLKPRG